MTMVIAVMLLLLLPAPEASVYTLKSVHTIYYL